MAKVGVMQMEKYRMTMREAMEKYGMGMLRKAPKQTENIVEKNTIDGNSQSNQQIKSTLAKSESQ